MTQPEPQGCAKGPRSKRSPAGQLSLTVLGSLAICGSGVTRTRSAPRWGGEEYHRELAARRSFTPRAGEHERP